MTGEVAVKFFEKTRLEPRVLGEVCIFLHRGVAVRKLQLKHNAN